MIRVSILHTSVILFASYLAYQFQALDIIHVVIFAQPIVGLGKALFSPILFRMNFISAWEESHSSTKTTLSDSYVFYPPVLHINTNRSRKEQELFSVSSSLNNVDKTASHPTVGILFFPGALVEPIAYSLLLERLANDTDTLVVLARCPFRLSPLWSLDKTLNAMNRYPSVQTWILGGHSFGAGTFGAAGMVAKLRGSSSIDNDGAYSRKQHSIKVSGVFMLGGNIIGDDVDLSKEEEHLECLAILASEDTITAPKGNNAHDGIPVMDGIVGKCPKKSTTVAIIEGGNHAGFGHYGPQTYPVPDGERLISHEEQQNETIRHLSSYIDKIKKRHNRRN